MLKFIERVAQGAAKVVSDAFTDFMDDLTGHPQLIEEIEREWHARAYPVRFGPVHANFYGTKPCTEFGYSDGKPGAFGVMEGGILFIRAKDKRRYVFKADRMRWIGLRRIGVESNVSIAVGDIDTPDVQTSRRALIIHFEDEQDQWRIATFTLNDLKTPLALLQTMTRLQVYSINPGHREFYGPHDAAQVQSGNDGQWDQASAVGGQLLVAPDRLIFNQRTVVLFANIRAMHAHKRVTGGKYVIPIFADDLLQVDYGTDQSTGFIVQNAPKWINHIQRRIRSQAQLPPAADEQPGANAG